MEQTEFRQGISPSFMEAMNPSKEAPQAGEQTTLDLEPQGEAPIVDAEVPQDSEQEVVADPTGEEIIEVGEVPPAEGKPTLEMVEQPITPPVQQPTYEVEGLDKLQSFMLDTGGTISDYVQLNRDISKLDDVDVIKEYYKVKSPHLDGEDLAFKMDEKFLFDEEEDTEREIRAKKIAFKEELYDARNYLDGQKDKYYADVKVKGGASPESLAQDKLAEENHIFFEEETNKFFNGFDGFNFSLGEGKPTVRYKVENVDNLKEYQSDLNNVLGEFVDQTGKVKDAAGYHKAVFAMKNADKIAQLFYDQGFAMAVKERSQDSKNTDFKPQHHAPVSGSKLAPGQAREIEHPNQNTSSSPKVRMKYWK